MARYNKTGVFVDGQGSIIQSATINVYLAGTVTPASIYTASSGGVAVNSVTSDATTGKFSLWIDDTDYDNEQLFKIEMSKTNFQSLTYDDIVVFPIARLILDASTSNYIDGRTYPREVTLGATRMEHTPAIAGTRALHIDVRPTGFDDTNCAVMRLDLEASSSPIRAKCINMSADISGATNAHVNLAEFAKSGDKAASVVVDAIDTRPGIRVIHQHSGTLGAVDNAFKYDTSATSYTDVTTAFGSAGTDVTVFDEDGDIIYLGHSTQFQTIEVILATVASNPGVKPTFEYSKGAGVWGTLSVSDDTNGFRENGNIFYATPSDWVTDTVNAVASKYWVRITRTTNSLATIPIEDTIKVALSTEYTWDESGNLEVNSIKTDGANALKTKVIDIGDWNMDATPSVSIAHGLTIGNIRSVSAIIRNDADDSYYPLTLGVQNPNTEAQGFLWYVTGSNVSLHRKTSGSYDSALFDATSYNRGWITITYIA